MSSWKETRMKKIKRLCIPALLGVVLVIMVVGVANARPNARPQQQAWRVLTVPSQACIPQEEDDDWYHTGIWVGCNTPQCAFFCPVDFPAAGEQAVGAVNVKRVTMYAYDDSGDPATALFWLNKTYPPNKSQKGMAWAWTGNSPTDPQTVVDTSIEYNPIYRVQGAHVALTIGAAGIRVYGFFIHYTWI
jgi:hypothetical protein